MTGVAKNTVLKLLVDLGRACSEYQDRVLRNLPCRRIQADEAWAFCYAKQKNIPEELHDTEGVGDVWTWTALCADTKLIPSWYIGGRSGADAAVFIRDLASRLTNRIQLTTDGHRVYLQAVENAFGADIDYAMLVKIYSTPPTGGETRYSPAECCGTMTQRISGHPDERKISTSFVERSNLTLRMSNRRFTRLTNAFSKKLENLEHSVALHFMHYNFARIHQSLRVTPAMEAGVSDHVWSVEEIIGLLDTDGRSKI